MRYRLLKIYVRLLLRLFCADIVINDKRLLQLNGPLLITANHPNSFFDALLVATHFKKSIYFLARGDVFKNDRIARVLRWLRIIPIHRITEGPENLHLNEATFEQCRQIFRSNGIVLIFIEGLSKHEWTLRPFKKGAARLALSSWASSENENQLQVLPMGLTYSDYNGFGKNVVVEMGEPMCKNDFDTTVEDGKAIVLFNEKLTEHISNLIIDVVGNTPESLNKALTPSDRSRDARSVLIVKNNKKNPLRLLLLIPALIGYIMHAPLYYPIKMFVAKKIDGTVFFDSVLFGCLLILYPFYLLLIVVIVYVFSGSLLSWFVLLVMPLCARAAVCFGFRGS